MSSGAPRIRQREGRDLTGGLGAQLSEAKGVWGRSLQPATNFYGFHINNLENNKITCAIFLDLAKAFDTVNHAVLLQKLHTCGIRGTALDLFESYLKNRKHYTVVHGVSLGAENVTCGVPQGSTLGPLLFILYMNDLPLNTNFKVNLFADDTNLIMSGSDAKHLEMDINNELANVDNWMRKNKLSINFSTTEYMLISRKKEKSQFKVFINDNEISKNNHIKYLGVLLDNKLTWHHHIEKVRTKVIKGIWAIARLKNLVSTKILLSIYYTMIFSHLINCNLAWESAAKTVLTPAHIFQKKAARLITNQNYKAHANPLFKKLKILTIFDIHRLEIAKYMFKAIQHHPGTTPS